MCQKIIVNRGEIEIESVGDLCRYFSLGNIESEGRKLNPSECLCPVDIEALLQYRKVPFIYTGGDCFIGTGLNDLKS